MSLPPDIRVPEGQNLDELLRLLIDSVVDYAIFVLDPSGYVSSWNPGAQRIKGYTAAEIIGRHFSCFFSAEDIAHRKPWKELETAEAEGRAEDEGWRIRKDGSRFWANVVLTALRNEKGTLIGFAKITRDMTERRQVEQSARRLKIERAARTASEEARQLAIRAADRATRLQTITAALSEALTPSQVVEAVITQGLDALGAFGGFVFLLEDSSQQVELLRSVGYPPEQIAPFSRFPREARNMVADVIRSGTPLFFESAEEFGAAYPQLLKSGSPMMTQALASLPLMVKGKAVGAMVLSFGEARRFSPDERAFLIALGHHCAQALERAHLYEQEQRARAEAEAAEERSRRQASRLRLMADVSKRFAESSSSLQTLLDLICRRASEIVGDGCGIRLLTDDGRFLYTTAVHHTDPAAKARMAELFNATPQQPAGEGISGEVIRSGRSVLIPVVPRAAQAPSNAPIYQRYVEQFPIYSMMVIPLSVQGQVLGVLAISRNSPEHPYTAEDQALMEDLAERAALAIRSARLLESQQKARAAAEFLAEASELFASSLDHETTLQNLAHMCVARLADWCAVEIAEQDDTRQIAVAHKDPQKVELARELRRRYPPDRNAPQGVYEVMRTGKPELYPEIPEELLVQGARDAEHLRLSRALGLRSAIIVPLVARDAILGAITLVAAESGRKYGQADLEAALELARRAALPIENARLYQRATRAIEARDEFLAIAGHELRTPVSALRLHLETMLRRARKPEGALPERVMSQLRSADRMVARLTGLIDDLLDVSRISSGRLALDLSEVDASALVREVVGRLPEDQAHGHCDIALCVEDDIPVYWDEARIDQVVTNLLTNACKYGAGKPIELTLSRKDGWMELVIRDHGIGIPPEAQERIFERFERAVSVRDYRGLGVGLWIVRELVRAHGGLILLESSPGVGSTFTVRLPADSRDAASQGA